jgi:hypothetical protein
MSRHSWIAVLVAAVAVAATGCGSVAQAEPAPPRALLLRLPDLPPGHLVTDRGCGVVAGEGATAALTELYLRHPHRMCSASFHRAWSAGGANAEPTAVQSAAIRVDTVAGAETELALADDVVAYLVGGSLTRLDAPASPVGEATLAYRTGSEAVVLWRSGRVLGLVRVAGLDAEASEQEALRLAAVQQGRIATPTRLGPSDYDDSAVPLDDPDLGIAVHWLGRRFAPGGKLGPLVLQRSEGPVRRGEGPGWRAVLQYGRARYSGTSVELGLWTRRAWRRFVRSRDGGLVRREPCTRAERIPLAHGHAVLYVGFEQPQTRCEPGRQPDLFMAHVVLERLVVSINIPYGYAHGEGGGLYDSATAIRRVIRALRARR